MISLHPSQICQHFPTFCTNLPTKFLCMSDFVNPFPHSKSSGIYINSLYGIQIWYTKLINQPMFKIHVHIIQGINTSGMWSFPSTMALSSLIRLSSEPISTLHHTGSTYFNCLLIYKFRKLYKSHFYILMFKFTKCIQFRW